MFLVNYLPKIVKRRKITSKYLKIDMSVLLQLQMPQHFGLFRCCCRLSKSIDITSCSHLQNS